MLDPYGIVSPTSGIQDLSEMDASESTQIRDMSGLPSLPPNAA